MSELVQHLVTPIVSDEEAVQVNTVEGDDVTIHEVIVADDDRSALTGDQERALRSIRTIVSAASGRRHATVELVEAFTEDSGEE